MNKFTFFVVILLIMVALALFLESRVYKQLTLPKQVHDVPASDEQAAGLNHLDSFGEQGIADLSVADIKIQLDNFGDISNPNKKAHFIALLQRWVALDERGALDYAYSLGDRDIKQQATMTVGDFLSHSDPNFLAENILSLPGNESNNILIRELANVWPQTDVKSALAWAEQLPEGTDKDNALFIIRSQWALQNPEAASVQIANLEESDSTSALVASIATHWAINDPAKAIEWANTLPDSERALAMSNLATVWAQHDPLAAASFVAQLAPGETQNQATRSVISSWANQDPQSTAAWVLDFPNGDLQNQGINMVVTEWNMVDPVQAQNWVLSLPAGAVQDAALKAFAESIVYSVGDPMVQEQSMESIMQTWSKDDPTTAKNWLAGWNVNADVKARLQLFVAAN